MHRNLPLTEFNRLEETLRLASIDCAVSLREIYEKVPFPEEAVSAG